MAFSRKPYGGERASETMRRIVVNQAVEKSLAEQQRASAGIRANFHTVQEEMTRILQEQNEPILANIAIVNFQMVKWWPLVESAATRDELANVIRADTEKLHDLLPEPDHKTVDMLQDAFLKAIENVTKM